MINNDNFIDKNFKWAQLKPRKLDTNICIKRLREPRSMLIDEPLLPSIVTQLGLKIIDKSKSNNYSETHKSLKNEKFKKF